MKANMKKNAVAVNPITMTTMVYKYIDLLEQR